MGGAIDACKMVLLLAWPPIDRANLSDRYIPRRLAFLLVVLDVAPETYCWLSFRLRSKMVRRRLF